MNITWTPTEDGGVRELIIFNANGVLKHQAVLLGRAEAPKKKKVPSQINSSVVVKTTFTELKTQTIWTSHGKKHQERDLI